jgi:hypothetical protein
MANRIGDYMEGYHCKFIRGTVPERLEKNPENGMIRVTWKQGD